ATRTVVPSRGGRALQSSIAVISVVVRVVQVGGRQRCVVVAAVVVRGAVVVRAVIAVHIRVIRIVVAVVPVVVGGRVLAGDFAHFRRGKGGHLRVPEHRAAGRRGKRGECQRRAQEGRSDQRSQLHLS